MGGLCSCWNGETRTVTVSESVAPGLALSDVAQLKQCMRRVTGKDLAVHFGLELFVDIFTSYPYIRAWFPTFRTSPSQVYSDPRMMAHVATVMQAIQSYVDHSHEFDTLVGLIEKMAVVHLNQSVTTVDMEVFGKVFIHHMKKVLGNRFSAKREKAWTKFFSLHNKIYKRVELEWLHGGADKSRGSQFTVDQLGHLRESRGQFTSITPTGYNNPPSSAKYHSSV